jgi:signal transduction histidine kinase
MDTAKTNFIATISHELKTPLASSDFSLKLLEDSRVGILSDEQRRLISQLKADNQRMLRILSELLNMAQLEAGKLQMHITPVSLQAVIQQSVSAVESHLKERSLQLYTDIPGSLPDVPADADKIGWVLNNFLTNAIRYSPPGAAIIIRVRQQEEELACEVEDQGPGIAPAYRTQIFERYFQVPGRADNQGSGIGLAICKEFIEAMGGRIWVNSGPGQGSVFGFALHIS